MEEVIVTKHKLSCCKSYTTPKGRCYTCPDEEEMKDPEDEGY